MTLEAETPPTPSKWERIKSECYHSISVAGSYLLFLGAIALDDWDSIASVILDPQIIAQVTDELGGWKHGISMFARIVALVTIFTRMRGLIVASKKK